MWNTVFSVIKIPSLFQIFASFGENQIEIGVKRGWMVNLQSLKESRRLIKKDISSNGYFHNFIKFVNFSLMTTPWAHFIQEQV